MTASKSPVPGATGNGASGGGCSAENDNQSNDYEAVTQAWRLYINERFTGVTVRSDNQYPTMWRIHAGDQTSDMVNLARAKDAAIAWARPRGLGGGEYQP